MAGAGGVRVKQDPGAHSGASPSFTGHRGVLGKARLVLLTRGLANPPASAAPISLSSTDEAFVVGRAKSLGKYGAGKYYWIPPRPQGGDGLSLLSREHLVIQCKSPDEWTVMDKSSNGTWLQGSKLPRLEACSLFDGDVISIGKMASEGYTISFRFDCRTATKAAARRRASIELERRSSSLDAATLDVSAPLSQTSVAAGGAAGGRAGARDQELQAEVAELKAQLSTKELDAVFQKERADALKESVSESMSKIKEEMERCQECPVCMMSIVRCVTFAKCGHALCLSCWFECYDQGRTSAASPLPPCTVCNEDSPAATLPTRQRNFDSMTSQLLQLGAKAEEALETDKRREGGQDLTSASAVRSGLPGEWLEYQERVKQSDAIESRFSRLLNGGDADSGILGIVDSGRRGAGAGAGSSGGASAAAPGYASVIRLQAATDGSGFRPHPSGPAIGGVGAGAGAGRAGGAGGAGADHSYFSSRGGRGRAGRGGGGGRGRVQGRGRGRGRSRGGGAWRGGHGMGGGGAAHKRQRVDVIDLT